MKLLEALRLANAPQQGPEFRVLLACGFTPLHLETLLKARLRMAFPGRTIQVRTGLYGDLAGTLERAMAPLHGIVVGLEWADIDPRLSWRSPGHVSPDLLVDARTRLARIQRAVKQAAGIAPVVLSLPALGLAPVFTTHQRELHKVEAALRAMLYDAVCDMPAMVLHPDELAKFSAHDLRSELSSGFPYTFAFADALADKLIQVLQPAAPKKGLITDLDGTLWNGILGDDGVDGVSWDLEHKTYFHGLYQSVLRLLSESGTLIGVASKNDPALVEEALRRRDLMLDASRVFPVEAHWDSKAQSIERILRAWNIGADSVIFVDDNELELEQIKALYPEIECIQFRPDDPEFLISLRDRFAKRDVREEDKLRVESLRKAEEIRIAVSDSATLDTLLAGANAKLTIYEGTDAADARALELVNKTNQFNLNGARYAEPDWKTFLEQDSSRLMVVDYEDRFGRLGKIAVIAGEERDGALDVNVWVMSCRAFSRRIEHQCLKWMLDRWNPIQLRYARTDRNGPLQIFLSEVANGDCRITRDEFARRCPPLYHQTEVVNVSGD